MLNYNWMGLWVVVMLGSTVGASPTELTGPHSGFPDGYAISSGTYDVPADSGGVPSATFYNSYDGLAVGGANTVLTIGGGQFDGNFDAGVACAGGATITISGGVFNNNSDGLSVGGPSVVTIDGGQFADVTYSLYDNGGTIDVYGGQFSTTGVDPTNDSDIAALNGTVDVFGAFAGVADGQTFTLTADQGSFYGQLEDNSSPATYTYVQSGRAITLHGTGTLVPEPATIGVMAFVGAGLLSKRPRV